MRLLTAGCLCGIFFVTAIGKTQEPKRRNKPADEAELAGITARGLALAAYDAAAWYGSDAVQALNAPPERVGMYIGRRTEAGWVIGFGRLNEKNDRFVLWYEAVPTADVKRPTVTVHDPALEDDGEWLAEARVFERLKQELTSHGRPYNLAILPATNRQWYAYAYPAQTDLSVFPYGGDSRYLFSADGSKLIETHKMHASIIENKVPQNAEKLEMTYRTAFLDDAPEDTDVAEVIMMGHVPMLVAAPTFVYRIEADGTAKYIAPTKIFLKDAGKASAK